MRLSASYSLAFTVLLHRVFSSWCPKWGDKNSRMAYAALKQNGCTRSVGQGKVSKVGVLAWGFFFGGIFSGDLESSWQGPPSQNGGPIAGGTAAGGEELIYFPHLDQTWRRVQRLVIELHRYPLHADAPTTIAVHACSSPPWNPSRPGLPIWLSLNPSGAGVPIWGTPCLEYAANYRRIIMCWQPDSAESGAEWPFVRVNPAFLSL